MEKRVKILKSTVVEKKTALKDSIVHVSKKDADFLVRTGRGELLPDEVKAEAKEEFSAGEPVSPESEEKKEEKPKSKSKK